MNKIYINKVILIIAILFTFLISNPKEIKAFDMGRLIDPACIFACKDSVNSKVYINNNSDQIYPNYTYPSYQPAVSALGASCYSTPTSAGIGENISWRSSAFGGNGSYNITWTGSDGLAGYGSNINKTYSSAGSKYASIIVTSGNQSISKNCSNNAQISDYNNYVNNSTNYYYDNYNSNYYRNYDYSYNNNVTPLYVSCYADRTYGPVDSSITWRANAYGGNGYYNYSWSGTDYLYGSGRDISTVYRSIGTKTATVTVYSGNQSTTQFCSNSVTIGQINNQYYYPNTYNPAVYYPNSYTNNSNNIQVACYPDKTNAKVGDNVSWSLEATGSSGSFTYNWSGSEGLIGNQSTINKVYGTSGTKTATVLVTSSNGQSITQTCGSSVVIGNTNSKSTNTKAISSKSKTNSTDSGIVTSILSLKNVPWILVGLLVLFIIIFIMIYLFINRNKI